MAHDECDWQTDTEDVKNKPKAIVFFFLEGGGAECTAGDCLQEPLDRDVLGSYQG
jgi:hypothetical protein